MDVEDETPTILVSACLLGRRVRYDGDANRIENDALERWRRQGWVVPFCPEVAGGLGTPRPPAEIEAQSNEEEGGAEPEDERWDGHAVLDGRARVVTESGEDVTDHFVAGAVGALEAARTSGAVMAILKEGSPSCGSGYVYDGTFNGSRREGAVGVTTALLERHGVRVFSESRLDEAARWLNDKP